eukprot:scaffold193181_cov39-Prasinocladus_malaysianus.AAC.1
MASSKSCSVYTATHHSTRTPVVLKIFSKERLTPMSTHQMARELHIHARMSHSNIINMVGWSSGDLAQPHYYILWQSGQKMFIILDQ